MAYPTPFDPATPTDANWLDQGDDRIREIKRGLIERFSTIIDNFPDGDPLQLNAAEVQRVQARPVPVTVGTLAARPSPPAEKGLIYYANDTDELFISVANGAVLEWEKIRQGQDQAPPVGVSALAGRPAPTTVGQLYYTTDEERLYIALDQAGSLVWVNTTYEPIATPDRAAFTYDTAAATGIRAAAVNIAKILDLRISTTIQTNYYIPPIELNEPQFDGKYHVNNIITIVATEQQWDGYFNVSAAIDSAANTVNLRVRQTVDSLVDEGLNITIGIRITFSA